MPRWRSAGKSETDHDRSLSLHPCYRFAGARIPLASPSAPSLAGISALRSRNRRLGWIYEFASILWTRWELGLAARIRFGVSLWLRDLGDLGKQRREVVIGRPEALHHLALLESTNLRQHFLPGPRQLELNFTTPPPTTPADAAMALSGQI
jgi:hypothetical protein